MARFEVHIPAVDPNGFNVTLKVNAEHWMAALKAGMAKLGEQGENSHNVMVDVQDDDSVHVTEVETGRVFRIRELTDAEAKQAVKKTSRPPPARSAPRFADRGDVVTDTSLKPGIGQEAPTPPPNMPTPLPAPPPPPAPPPAAQLPAENTDTQVKEPVISLADAPTLVPPESPVAESPAKKHDFHAKKPASDELMAAVLAASAPAVAASSSPRASPPVAQPASGPASAEPRASSPAARTTPPTTASAAGSVSAEPRASSPAARAAPPTPASADGPVSTEPRASSSARAAPPATQWSSPPVPAPAAGTPASREDAAKTLPGLPLPPEARVPLKHSSGRIDVRDVEELERPVKPTTGSIGRIKTIPPMSAASRAQAEDALADIFLRVAELSSMPDVRRAMDFVLELALEKVPCEGGSVLRADAATGELTFIAARGPRAGELLAKKLVIPAGTGIAGFCAAEGVSLALSDVEKDRRFYGKVDETVGFATKSILCSPMMTHGISFGAVQLVNRKGDAHFLEYESGVLAYLAHQAALYLNFKLME